MKGDYRDLALPPGTKVLMTRLPDQMVAGLSSHCNAIESSSPDVVAGPRPPARYTRPGEDGMNGLERRYASHLEEQKSSGQIFDFAFEPEKFRLANKGDACFYTPDFRVQMADGTIEFHDTKGFLEEDANIKMKWFVQAHPYPLVVVRWVKGAWKYERRGP